MTYACVDFSCDNSDHEGSDSHLPGHKELQAWDLTGLKLLCVSIQGFRVEGFRVHPKLYLASDIFRPLSLHCGHSPGQVEGSENVLHGWRFARCSEVILKVFHLEDVWVSAVVCCIARHERITAPPR